MTLKVLMFGPDPTVKGGISSLEKMLVGEVIDGASVSIIPTTKDSHFLRKISRGLASWFKMPFYLASKPDLIHIHFASRGSTWRKMPICLSASIFGTPVVLHAHGAEFQKFYSSECGPFRRSLIRAFLKRSSALIVLSESWKKFFMKISRIDEEKIHVFPNPVDTSLLEIKKQDNNDNVLIISNGRIGRRKGSFDSIEAFSKLSDDVLQSSCFIATGDGQVDELEKRIESMGLSNFAKVESWLPDKEYIDLRKKASIFLLPSYDEGLPMAMIEAMALGQVPIVSPVGGIPEVIVNEENGLLVSPGDIQSISEAISRLVVDRGLRERLSKAALETAMGLDVGPYRGRLGRLYQSIVE